MAGFVRVSSGQCGVNYEYTRLFTYLLYSKFPLVNSGVQVIFTRGYKKSRLIPRLEDAHGA